MGLPMRGVSIPLLEDDLAITLKAVAVHDRATLDTRESGDGNAAETASLFWTFGKSGDSVSARFPVAPAGRGVLHIGGVRVLVHMMIRWCEVVGRAWMRGSRQRVRSSHGNILRILQGSLGRCRSWAYYTHKAERKTRFIFVFYFLFFQQNT